MRRFLAIVFFACAIALTGCASNLVASQMGGVFRDFATASARDDDPELVWASMPFALKTIDGLLVSAPNDTALLATAASSYTQYAWGHLVQDADMVEKHNHDLAKDMKLRARNLLVRARDYGLRGLDASHPGLVERLRANPVPTLASLGTADAPLLYWTACAWGAAIAVGSDDAELTADQFIVEAMMRRVLELDERYESGGAHDFFIAYEGARSSVGGSYEAATEHFKRSVAISGGRRVAPYATYAESVLLPQQKRDEFVRTLEEALRIPADADSDHRLANAVAVRRARWLLENVDELFLEP